MRLSRRDLLGAAAGAIAVTLGAACSRRGSGPGDDVEVISYGPARQQHLELSRPSGVVSPPVVALLHGGFWRNTYDLDLMRPMVPGLLALGWAVANVEYRRLGDAGGGWPGTFTDVTAALEHLGGMSGLDASRIVTVGHSAGGHLAVWAAAQGNRADRPANVGVIGAVSLAGVLDLATASADRLGGDATTALLGGTPETVPEVYAEASPIELVPIGVPIELIHGRADDLVPFDQSERFAQAARRAGGLVTLTEVAGDHFALIDPSTAAGEAARGAIERLLA